MLDLKSALGKKANKFFNNHQVGKKIHNIARQVGKKSVALAMQHPVSGAALAGFTQGAAAAQSMHEAQGTGMPKPKHYRLQLKKCADRRRNDKGSRRVSLYPPGHQPQWATPNHLRK